MSLCGSCVIDYVHLCERCVIELWWWGENTMYSIGDYLVMWELDCIFVMMIWYSLYLLKYLNENAREYDVV